jgi:N-acetylmuramoyl-L-alanine amidase
MPAPGNPVIVCRFFRLRYGASLLLSGGVFFCALKALNLPTPPLALPQKTASLPVETTPPAPESKPEIVIDPGHGGGDPGTSAHGQQEKTWTLSIGKALAKELETRGWPVVLTRYTDSTLALLDRSIFANQKTRLAFVSLHFNSGGPEASGIETYYAWPRQPEAMARLNTLLETPEGQSLLDERSRLLAETLQASVCTAAGAKNRGVRNDPAHSVTSRTVCPAVLVELGFLTNAAECRSIQSEAYREKIVRGLADGIELWLHEAAAPGYGIRFEPPGTSLPVASRSSTIENH